ncbi:MAG: membrane protein insertase YidC [Candidatus Aminicenantes bacterium]|nr:membrane protein insertase YidC [Candidatus Aminicenantes bacterium]
MDTKRLIIAIALSIVIITIYQVFFMPKPKPRPQLPPTEVMDQVIADKQAKGTEPTIDDIADVSDIFAQKKEEPVAAITLDAVKEDLKANALQEVTVETGLFTAVFTNEGAGLKSFILKKYKDDKMDKDDKMEPLDLVSEKAAKLKLLPFHFSTFEGNELFKMLNNEKFVYSGETYLEVGDNQQKEILFQYKDMARNVSVTKKFIISNNYVVGIECELIKDGVKLAAPIVFGPDLENDIREERMGMKLQIGAFDGGDIRSVKFASKKTRPSANKSFEIADGRLDGFFYWAAYERAYFAAIFKRAKQDSPIKYYIIKKKIAEKKTELYSYMIVMDPQYVYLGPKDEDILRSVEHIFPGVNEVIEYGWFGFIAKLLLKGITFIHGFIPNLGWALVIFTIFLKILLFPLTYKSSVSMGKMQTLQPKIKAIKKKYKNLKDPEQRKQMNVETMALYKTEKVNPMGGCLPLLLQMPILFGFFNLLRTSINVRHEAWILWIMDLSLKDPIYLLPILMGASQIIVQKMSPSSGDPTQKKMMYLMPVVITFFVMSLPSGLTLYWFVSNLLQIGQQQIINKKMYQQKKDEERQMKSQKRKKGKGVKGK